MSRRTLAEGYEEQARSREGAAYTAILEAERFLVEAKHALDQAHELHVKSDKAAAKAKKLRA